jgi:excinuclease ABC subunit C
MLDAGGTVIYVGKAKRVRARLMSYFRASYPDDKAARILAAASDITWDYAPSEFGAHLAELRLIRRFRPRFNVQMNRLGTVAFVKVSSGTAPKVYVGRTVSEDTVSHYGPFRSAGQLRESVRVLNLELGLRDCALDMPVVYAEQGDLFSGAARRVPPVRAGTCLAWDSRLSGLAKMPTGARVRGRKCRRRADDDPCQRRGGVQTAARARPVRR